MTDRSTLAWYVCGPMAGLQRFNYPLFDMVTANLREDKARTVVSPTELDSQQMQDAARASLTGNMADLDGCGETWGDVLARDVKLIEKQIGHFALLPNWERSRGARLEVFVGLLVGITDFNYVTIDGNGKPFYTPVDITTIRNAIRQNIP